MPTPPEPKGLSCSHNFGSSFSAVSPSRIHRSPFPFVLSLYIFFGVSILIYKLFSNLPWVDGIMGALYFTAKRMEAGRFNPLPPLLFPSLFSRPLLGLPLDDSFVFCVLMIPWLFLIGFNIYFGLVFCADQHRTFLSMLYTHALLP